MASLVAFAQQSHEALEADLLRYFQVDLLDLYRGRLSLRRLRVLINALPPDAAIYRRNDEHGGWTVTDHLLATVIDALGAVGYYSLVGPHVDPKRLRSVKPPQRMHRPGDEARKRRRRQATSDDLKQIFGGATAYRPTPEVTDGDPGR